MSTANTHHAHPAPKPSKGRIVRYIHRGPGAAPVELAAIITKVHDADPNTGLPESVNLFVYPEFGAGFPCGTVPYDENKSLFSWHWAPRD